MYKKIRMRTLFIGGVITLFFMGILIQMYTIQVSGRSFWLANAEKQWAAENTILPVRGSITDRNGKVLAKDGEAYTVAVDPDIIHKLGIQDEVVAGLHRILGIAESKIRDSVNSKGSGGAYRKYRELGKDGRKVDTEAKDKIDQLKKTLREKTGKNNVGIILTEDFKRYYPKEEMASHVLGYVTKEGKPAIGLEAFFDKTLMGTAGSIAYEKDRKGQRLPDAKVEYKPAVDGDNITLTIDENIQHFMEEALRKADSEYHPKSMTAVAVDPKTMEILGLANTPDFNPEAFWETKDLSAFMNHAVASVYEPGSTFKIVTLAAAVEEGLFDPNAKYQSGSIRVPGKLVRDIKRGGWGKITYLEGLKRSSNVAFVHLGYEKLGPEKFLDYIHKFGFGQKTGVDLPGEVSRTIEFPTRTDAASATYGQGQVNVTPIQQVTAIAAVANGGKLMWPHIVKEIKDPANGKVIQKFEPKQVAQVISPETSKKVSEYLEQVVSDRKIGTGRNAYIEGYRVAGKTGTAQKVINGKYSDDKFVVSFIGYAPVEDPRILVYVLVDEPDVPSDLGGGAVAAPIFQEIVSQSLRYMKVPSSTKKSTTTKVEQSEPGINVPNMLGVSVKEAKEQLNSGDISYMVLGKGAKVTDQIPQPGGMMSAGQRVYLLTSTPDKTDVPDLSGKPLQEALQISSLLGLQASISGEGYVTAQSLQTVKGVRTLKLALKPMSITEAAKAETKAETKAEEGSDD
ncbi:penicillin-binding protein [Paenibacillus gansuensis]|uniref:Penicillin-binding protein n=1 Tax=Paenibacillus gansuensis TaxID=306542 RepID=A0ABW5PEN7_9BACL